MTELSTIPWIDAGLRDAFTSRTESPFTTSKVFAATSSNGDDMSTPGQSQLLTEH